MQYEIGQRVRRYKDEGTVVDICEHEINGYIVQMDKDEPGAVIAASECLLQPAS